MAALSTLTLDQLATLDLAGLARLLIDPLPGGFKFAFMAEDHADDGRFKVFDQSAATYRITGYSSHTTSRYAISGEQAYQGDDNV